ncbi:MAG: hypothetical protein EBV03_08605 [Proteobacteria bacterium]|nr:hypothetical protein [Pseudomonadota bacterium]
MNQEPAPTTPKEPSLKIQDVITITARLAQLLAEEVDLLTDMKVAKIEALQQEKLFLVSALEAQRKLVDKHPALLETIPSQDKKDLEDVVDLFKDILAENHRKLLLAKEVNHKIVEAVTAVVKESTQSRVYSANGITGATPYETLSVTLNKTI